MLGKRASSIMQMHGINCMEWVMCQGGISTHEQCYCYFAVWPLPPRVSHKHNQCTKNDFTLCILYTLGQNENAIVHM